MGESSISWCDGTVNYWIGCSVATWTDAAGRVHTHESCVNCYARDFARRWGVKWGDDQVRKVTTRATQLHPYAWARAAEKAGKPFLVFPNSLSDVLDPRAPVEAQGTLWQAVRDTWPWCRWLILTKRPQDWRKVPEDVRPLVWFGTSVANQPTADIFVPRVLAAEGFRGLFLSVAPQVGPVEPDESWLAGDYVPADWDGSQAGAIGNAIGWVIHEGESGNRARPFELAGARALRDQCRAAGVPYHLKQVGSLPILNGFKFHCLDPHGGNPMEWPEDLRVREFPKDLR